MFIALLSLLITHSCFAMGRGDLSVESRYFPKDKSGQAGQELQFSATLQDRFKLLGSDLNLSIISRTSNNDKKASYIDFNELYYSLELPYQIDVNVGYQVFNWSKMEAFKTVDIINSRYLDGNIESFDKKGELSLSLEKYSDFGNMKFFFFPQFKKSTFPSVNSRLADGARPKEHKVVSGNETHSDNYVAQFGLSFEKQVGDLDFLIFALKHIDRTRVILGYDEFVTVLGQNIPSGKLRSFYLDTFDLGLSSTFFIGEHTLKFEVVKTEFDVDNQVFLTNNGIVAPLDHSILGFGYEYTHIWNQSSLSSTIFLEYQKVAETGTKKSQQINVFQSDIFLGYRLSFNDPYSKELILSVFYDTQRSSEWILNISYSQRLTDFWKFKTGYRAYGYHSNDKLGLALLDGDDEFFLKITRSF